MKKVLSLMLVFVLAFAVAAPITLADVEPEVETEGTDVVIAPISVEVDADDAETLPEPVQPPVEGLPFLDVEADAWYIPAVVWSFENKIMNGMTDTEFEPGTAVSRAMVVTILGRYYANFVNENLDLDAEYADKSTFADVAEDAWFATYVNWAAANGIVEGVGGDEFAPDQLVNRAQLYTILYRYMNYVGLTVELDEEALITEFADKELFEVFDWAEEAMLFMYNAGIMFRESTLDITANPGNNAPRAEIAGAIYFFDMNTVTVD